MPEYLAPGVYVEEVDTGSKPIEGVSTSTAGIVGVTERGPRNVPVLITSAGEFARWFGGYLRGDYYGNHRFLPHAIGGFFTNGGKRVFVTRVLDEAATKAESPLFDRGDASSLSTRLLRPAGEQTGSAASPPKLVVLEATGLSNNDWVRVGDGSPSEYRQVDGNPDPDNVTVAIHLPLSRSHPTGEVAAHFAWATLPGAYTLDDEASAGSTVIVARGTHADIALLAAGDCVEVGGANVGEYRFVVEATSMTAVDASDSTVRLRLDAPLLLGWANASPVARVDLSAAPVDTASIETAAGGSGVFFVDNRGGNFDDRTHLVRLGAGITQEVRRIGELSNLAIAPPAYDDYTAGALVQVVTFPTPRTLSAAAVAGATEIDLQPGETAGLVRGQRIVIEPGPSSETVTIVNPVDGDTLKVTPLAALHTAGQVVPLAKRLTAPAGARTRVLALDDRRGIREGDVLWVGAGASSEQVTVTALPALTFVAPDPGNVVVAPALAGSFPTGTSVDIRGTATPLAGRQPCVLALPAPAGTPELLITDGDNYLAGATIRVAGPGGPVFHWIATNATAAAPFLVTLQTALARAHRAGSPLVTRAPLFDVQALDAGIWGNRLRVSVEDETPGLVSPTTLDLIVDPTHVRLASASGVQPGTVLELFDTATGATVGDPVKVSNVNRADFTLTLAGTGLSGVQQVPGLGVRSREFRLTVRLLRQPDAVTPSRNEEVIDSEVFRYLSMDPRHSNYIESVIGDKFGPLRKWDRRTEGASLYVRVSDWATTQTEKEAVRLGPETLVDVLPDRRRLSARLRLETTIGSDAIGTLTDAHYAGQDNADPELRTGLQSLRNVEEVSIVAIPGQVSAQVQQALIDHCELLRYRFAVLDARPEPQDNIADVQAQRQQFDTRYAALYYPWLAIPDPFPTPRPGVQDYPVPPSGHVIGIFARTDIERGVHKAPANEVVRGIVNLRRKINKEQQDILNPYPSNINVIRDFREDNRGIRVFGARVITGDPDWKYVNVRRLLIFIEASIERGLQWVVFEPNAEPLWARVRRIITNFLTTAWRNGALEGTKVEEAFFVRCDRTTMTQDDIDNGRLIVLVGVAPVKPAEFVIIRIGLWTARGEN